MSKEMEKLKVKQLNKDVKYWSKKANASWEFEKEFRHLMRRINSRDYDSQWENVRLFEALYHLERHLP